MLSAADAARLVAGAAWLVTTGDSLSREGVGVHLENREAPTSARAASMSNKGSSVVNKNSTKDTGWVCHVGTTQFRGRDRRWRGSSGTA